ncbi:hypothetical protein GIB67_019304 [Kingdonia uniflora]|uniref:Endoplasmic reticulum vesicle transporter N-terminal domain-containing protein n=1 Tax=Kingdonia uniflora TaxID=39325 RepID=A0A7J7L1C5_9MAGN|nr:hypothetical protein GIB67_019304 [Kingdonia uniflora]
MISSTKLKSIDFYRKIPRDLTEASISGAGLSIITAFFSMMFLFGMEFGDYLTLSTSTLVAVNKSKDGELLQIELNISFPTLSCEFASIDINDVLGTDRLNITKTIRKFSIDRNLIPTGTEYHPGPVPNVMKHEDEGDEEYSEGSASLTADTFLRYAQHYPILVVNFFAPWCYWSNHLKPSWEKKESHPGYPSIQFFCKGSDLWDEHGQHDNESYYGDQDTKTLVKRMEALVAPVPIESDKLAVGNKSGNATRDSKRPMPLTCGCRIKDFVHVKKVLGYLVISSRSESHSFDPSQMNISHVISHLSLSKKISSSRLK